MPDLHHRCDRGIRVFKGRPGAEPGAVSPFTHQLGGVATERQEVTRAFHRLEDYGILGNLETCALVSRFGSLDWCCFPQLESPSVFAALLDPDSGGHFSVAPAEPFHSVQSYLYHTNVVQTDFSTGRGLVRLLDFMPVTHDGRPRNRSIFRKVTCLNGTMDLAVDFSPRFDYGRRRPTFVRRGDLLEASAGEDFLTLQASSPLKIGSGGAAARLSLNEGDTHWFALVYGEASFPETSAFPAHMEAALEETVRYWVDWAHTCERSRFVSGGIWHKWVIRSSLVLKLLTHYKTGAIAAAPTTSLPECPGGVRNWDYRYEWVRDACFTVQALYGLGHLREAAAYLKWLRRVCAKRGDAAGIRTMYTRQGGFVPGEFELRHLRGYRNSAPVRIGNAASAQRQLDIFGEMVDAFYKIHRYGRRLDREDWAFIREIADHVAGVWNTEDSGIWEIRGPLRHYTHSKVMCWVALDRAVKLARRRNYPGNVERWTRERAAVRRAILEHGYNRRLHAFVQSFGSDVLDASLLLIPLMGFLPVKDPRVQSTMEAVRSHLVRNGLVHRYEGDDALPAGEGAFAFCTFWWVELLAQSGCVMEAQDSFEAVTSRLSPLGLLAEEIDAEDGTMLGNFPQAFSHIGLINSAIYLWRAKGRTPTLSAADESQATA
ncbi:MAG: glycoside hydrolase family 15 protein [Acidobacteriota bacterium]